MKKNEIVEGINDIRKRMIPMLDMISLAFLKKQNAEARGDDDTMRECDEIINLQLGFIEEITGTQKPFAEKANS